MKRNKNCRLHETKSDEIAVLQPNLDVQLRTVNTLMLIYLI